MESDRRNKVRQPTEGQFQIKWLDKKGQVQLVQAQGVDVTRAGICVESPVALEPGTAVRVQSASQELMGSGVVRHCSAQGGAFSLGLSFTVESNWTAKLPARRPADHPARQRAQENVDHYELLQISPSAETQIIHRVYHMMAARFHPDNAETGNLEKFLALKQAYEILSDPERRTAYDASRQTHQDDPMPIFEMKDFVDGMEGETNRRLGVLSLLYNKRRTDQDHPGVSLLDLEKRMNFPREHLGFALWYLRAKGFVVAEDNSDYALTAAGADYVEENWPDNDILQRLICGPSVSADERRRVSRRRSSSSG